MSHVVSAQSDLHQNYDPKEVEILGRTFNFELLFSAGLLILFAGTYADMFEHVRRLEGLEDFFTTAHLVLYLGVLVSSGVFVYVIARNMAVGMSLKEAIPEGYQTSAIGIVTFGIAGFGDLIWHTLFGIEDSIEALYSPTHLLLFTSGLLFAIGPVISAMRKEDLEPRSWRDHLTLVLGLGFVLIVLTVFTAPFATFNFLWPEGDVAENAVAKNYQANQIDTYYLFQGMGSASVIISGIIYSMVFITVLRKFQLPPGGLSGSIAIFALPASIISGNADMVPAIMAWMLVLELISFRLPIHRSLRNNDGYLRNLRITAFLIPFTLFAGIYLLTFLQRGSWWEYHLLYGLPFLGGFAGLTSSYMITANQDIEG